MTVIFLSTHVSNPMWSFVDNLSKATVVFLAHIFTDPTDVIHCLFVVKRTVIFLMTHADSMLSFIVYMSWERQLSFLAHMFQNQWCHSLFICHEKNSYLFSTHVYRPNVVLHCLSFFLSFYLFKTNDHLAPQNTEHKNTTTNDV